MASTSKETVYIDIDDEITGIIEKLKASPGKIVAVVLPKRATVFHSIVNMKLLKRAAEQSRKNVVLITSEAGLLPLAGAVGLHVARTLQSKPVIPPRPDRGDGEDVPEVNESPGRHDGPDDEDEPTPEATAALAAASAAEAARPVPDLPVADDADETIELDADEPVATAAAKPKKKKIHGTTLKVPNFERFRKRLIFGGLAFVLLLVGWFYAFVSLPKATVTLKTDSSAIQADIPFTASAAIKEFDAEKKEVPATFKEHKQSDTEKISATGQKDVGNKATGSMTVFNCTDNDVDLPGGSVFTSGDFGFGTDQTVTVPASDFNSGGVCKKNNSATVPVTATQPGDKYNISSGRSFTSNFAATMTGTGSAMSGGTTQMLQVVAQADLDTAKAKMKDRLNDQAKTELKKLFGNDGLFAVEGTFGASEPVVTSEPKVGEQAGEVTVSAVTTYGMIGVKKDHLHELIAKQVDGQIDKSKQTLLDDGLIEAVFTVNERKANDNAKLTMQSIAQAGPQLDKNAIADSIRGKKKGEAQSLLLKRPGIKDVEISYSPFWVLSTPKAAKKINVVFEKPALKPASQDNDSSP
jgi:hypothetical protein